MPSPALQRFSDILLRADTITEVGLSGLSREKLQGLYGAAFTAQVAAWNAYVVALVEAFYGEVADPALATFHAMHTISSAHSRQQLERFNTPNSENTRNLLVLCTGYDPWNDWAWARSNLNALQVRMRLNEILKVRHSFAHGFTMPAFAWNQTPQGDTRINRRLLNWNRAFLNHIVAKTDHGMKAHLQNTYNRALTW